MKLLKMKNEQGELDYMVKLETEGEEDIYNTFGTDHILFKSMLGGMREHMAEKQITDDEVAYYFMFGEQEPAVGETFELDNIKWERIS